MSAKLKTGFDPSPKETSSPVLGEISWQRLARANTHPLRISILEVLSMDGGRTLSPSDLSYELRAPLSNINYHTTELYRSGLLRLVETQPVRGATEHFYRAAPEAETNGSNGKTNGSNGRHQDSAGHSNGNGRKRSPGINGKARAKSL
jgi:hypothetical protein